MPYYKIPKERLISLFPAPTPIRVKYKDIFDLKLFYKALYEYLLENGWKDFEDEFDHWETYYDERVTQGGAKEIWYQWRPYKPAEDGRFNYYLDFDTHCLYILPAEIIREGKKIKVVKGEIEMKFNAFIDQIYLGEMGNSSILKRFKDIFHKRIYHKAVDQRKKELYQEMYALQHFIKQWFKLKRYLPYEEVKGFEPSYAWPSHIKE